MDFYKIIQKLQVQIALYGTWPKFKKCLKNWFCPLRVKDVVMCFNLYMLLVLCVSSKATTNMSKNRPIGKIMRDEHVYRILKAKS
jgi:hypothetical protein